jgi:prepilin-type processing-associated H-X9-DG protein
MSLIELLCVMAIIAMLAALLLPALGQAQARARRLQCVDHLHQVGVGFVSFANDHNGQFPMAVPMSAGGTLELAQGGYLIEDDFYFSYRHFQAASNELVTPKLVVCPADSRPPATSFATLSNANLSYFIGVNAEAVRSSSILAGDRNLTNDYAAPGTLVRFGHNYALRWTDELHRYKGNLLFSDGHVAEKNGPALVSTGGQVPAIAELALPTVRQPGTTPSFPSVAPSTWTPSMPGSAIAPGPGSFGQATNARALLGAISVTRPDRGAAPEWLPFMAEVAASKAAPSPRGEKRSTNEVAATTPAKPQEETTSLSKFASWLAATTTGLVEQGIWWFYALLLLLAIAAVALREAARGRKTRRGAKSPPPH